MYLSILTMKLVFPFLLCQRVHPLGQLFFHNQSVFNNQIDDDLLEKFFAELIKPHIKKFEFRQTTVIAREPSNLRQVQPLLEIHPYVIYKQKRQFSDSVWLSHRSFVIIFLGDLSKETIQHIIDGLLRYTESTFLFISDSTIHFDDLYMILILTLRARLTYVKVAHVVGNAVQLNTNYIAANCSMGVEIITVWRRGDSLPNVEIYSWTHPIRDLKGCPISVSTTTSKPDMIVKENEDGSSSIIGGREGLLILTLAEKINFNMSVIRPIRRHGQLLFPRIEDIIQEKLAVNADINIGNLPQLLDSTKRISFSYPYVEECITWGVPRRIIQPNDIVWVEFRWQVWILVGLTFVISCVIGYAYLRMISTKEGEQTRKGFIMICFETVAIHLGIPVVYISSSVTGRFMLLAYLYYSIVITTAYRSSLAATLTGNRGASAIVDVEGIFKANITVQASELNYLLYRLQSDSESNLLLPLKQSVTNNNESDDLNLFSNYDNYGFLASRTSLNYRRQIMLKSGQSINFDILDGCEMYHHFVLYLRRESMIEIAINGIIRHLTEAGIIDHWGIEKLDVAKILMQQMLEEYYENRATDKFRDIFIFYSGCVAFCLLTFFIEFCTVKYP